MNIPGAVYTGIVNISRPGHNVRMLQCATLLAGLIAVVFIIVM